MNPNEARRRDWRLYYHRSYMQHATHGVVYISVENETFYTAIKGRVMEVNPDKLSCLWPAPRSINYNKTAIYIGRRPRREARRSMTAGHYYIHWAQGRFVLDATMIKQLTAPYDYWSLEDTIEALQNVTHAARAISPDIILSTRKLDVIFKGTAAGRLIVSDYGYELEPISKQHPLGDRVVMKLNKEGYACILGHQ